MDTAIAGNVRGPVRRLRVDGEQWVVCERDAPQYDRRRTPHLIFQSPEVVRRVRDYPAKWYELPDDELFHLSWRR